MTTFFYIINKKDFILKEVKLAIILVDFMEYFQHM